MARSLKKVRSLIVSDELLLSELKIKIINYESIYLNERQLCDLEMLMSGAFSPLKGFLGEKDYESVLEKTRLNNGVVWPIPITLDISKDLSEKINIGEKVVLRDYEGIALAILIISDKWVPDRFTEAKNIFGTVDTVHPAVDYLINHSGPIYLGGEILGLEFPRHYDFQDLRQTPAQIRERFYGLGWEKVIAFQTRNPMHCAHIELINRAAKEIDGKILVHPVVGMTKPGDVDHYTRVRCYKEVMKRFKYNTALLSLIPLAMRMGGPREALWHAIIRKNYGCTHLIIGRDHAGPGIDSKGSPFYGPYEAQNLVKKYSKEIGVEMVPFQLLVFVKEKSIFLPIDEVPKSQTYLNISGTELRNKLDKGENIPDWFTYPEVANELRKSHPPKREKGFTVFFTGLSGSGKSTIANALMIKLLENGRRPVTLLDGDIVRINLSSELGFSKEHRNLNIQRIGFVASEITKNRGIAICAPIAPYSNIREQNRALISQCGGYIEIYVSTPLEVCEKRDVKGLYAKARQGIIKGFTGLDDPYEEPANPEINIDTTHISQDEAIDNVLKYLKDEGYID
tara:strand:+ start:568 stop:2271 length:1704 start_codon:yes stop_codon:yes gene_type:complete